MRSMFSKLFLASAMTAAAALAVSSAAAQTVKVPFSFSAAGKSYPAGVYSVQPNLAKNAITLRNVNTEQSFSWIVGPGDPDPMDKNVALKFDDFGSSHVLHSIQYGSRITASLDTQRGDEESRTAARGQ